MPVIKGHCAACGHPLLWDGSFKGSLYCCDGCAYGACTCNGDRLPVFGDMEEGGFEMSTGSSERSDCGHARARLLVVDDDGEMRALLAEVLSVEGYEVEQAANGAEALIRLRTASFAAIILDKNMPGLSGLDLLPGLRTMCPEMPVILITAFGDIATYVDAVEKGAYAYLFKPFQMQELQQAVDRALASANGGAPAPTSQGVAP